MEDFESRTANYILHHQHGVLLPLDLVLSQFLSQLQTGILHCHLNSKFLHLHFTYLATAVNILHHHLSPIIPIGSFGFFLLQIVRQIQSRMILSKSKRLSMDLNSAHFCTTMYSMLMKLRRGDPEPKIHLFPSRSLSRDVKIGTHFRNLNNDPHSRYVFPAFSFKQKQPLCRNCIDFKKKF